MRNMHPRLRIGLQNGHVGLLPLLPHLVHWTVVPNQNRLSSLQGRPHQRQPEGQTLQTQLRTQEKDLEQKSSRFSIRQSRRADAVDHDQQNKPNRGSQSPEWMIWMYYHDYNQFIRKIHHFSFLISLSSWSTIPSSDMLPSRLTLLCKFWICTQFYPQNCLCEA